MTEQEEALNLLERPRAIKTLLTLLKSSDDTPVLELLKEIGGSRTTGINRLNDFRDVGLVTKEAGDNRTIYQLTDEGKEITQDLQEIVLRLEEIKQKSNNDE